MDIARIFNDQHTTTDKISKQVLRYEKPLGFWYKGRYEKKSGTGKWYKGMAANKKNYWSYGYWFWSYWHRYR